MVETSKLLVNTNFGKHLKKKKGWETEQRHGSCGSRNPSEAIRSQGVTLTIASAVTGMTIHRLLTSLTVCSLEVTLAARVLCVRNDGCFQSNESSTLVPSRTWKGPILSPHLPSNHTVGLQSHWYSKPLSDLQVQLADSIDHIMSSGGEGEDSLHLAYILSFTAPGYQEVLQENTHSLTSPIFLHFLFAAPL